MRFGLHYLPGGRGPRRACDYRPSWPPPCRKPPKLTMTLSSRPAIGGTCREICKGPETLPRYARSDIHDACVVLHPALHHIGGKPPLLLGGLP
jgi:hypothetical protein